LARSGNENPRSERPSLGTARALLPVSVAPSVVIPTFNEGEEDLEATPDGALLGGAARRSGFERLWVQLVLALVAVVLLATVASARNVARSSRWRITRPRAGRPSFGAVFGRARSAGHAVRGVSDGVALGSTAPIGAPGPVPSRAHQRTRIEALTCDLYVEAKSRDRSVGTVKGFAIAFACREHRRGAETYLLVSDPSKLAAVWVKESEIQLRSVAAQPRSREDGP